MSTNRTRARVAQSHEPSETTTDRIRAFLATMRPLRGSAIAGDEQYESGRSIIERVALSTEDMERPTLHLTPDQCADVLNFLSRSEPVEPEGWWRDPEDAPCHVAGLFLLLGALEDSLRGEQPQQQGAPVASSATAEQILAVVDEQQDSLINVESTIRCIKAKAQLECDELMGALELVETELGRIGEALEPGQIQLAIARQSAEAAP